MTETPGQSVSSNVTRRCLGDDLPDGGFDLVVVSEVGYFLSPVELDGLAEAVTASAPGGHVVLCHWRHDVVGWSLSRPELTERLTARLGLPMLASYADRDVGSARAADIDRARSCAAQNGVDSHETWIVNTGADSQVP